MVAPMGDYIDRRRNFFSKMKEDTEMIRLAEGKTLMAMVNWPSGTISFMSVPNNWAQNVRQNIEGSVAGLTYKVSCYRVSVQNYDSIRQLRDEIRPLLRRVKLSCLGQGENYNQFAHAYNWEYTADAEATMLEVMEMLTGCI
jgi:hypothetical protein